MWAIAHTKASYARAHRLGPATPGRRDVPYPHAALPFVRLNLIYTCVGIRTYTRNRTCSLRSCLKRPLTPIARARPCLPGRDGETFPADLLCLACGLPQGVAFVRTVRAEAKACSVKEPIVVRQALQGMQKLICAVPGRSVQCYAGLRSARLVCGRLTSSLVQHICSPDALAALVPGHIPLRGCADQTLCTDGISGGG